MISRLEIWDKGPCEAITARQQVDRDEIVDVDTISTSVWRFVIQVVACKLKRSPSAVDELRSDEDTASSVQESSRKSIRCVLNTA